MKYDVLAVRWEDSNVQHGWFDLGTVPVIAECITVGILDNETDEYISLVLSESNLLSRMERIIIPRSCIKKVKRFKVEV